jgi:ADP-heptose:LPS heptosyltransferase
MSWGENGLNLCGKTSPRVSALIFKKAEYCSLDMTVGPMHLAACVNTPCVAIFSARNIPRQWYPRGENNTIYLSQNRLCRMRAGKFVWSSKRKCIYSIKVQEVADAVIEVIQMPTFFLYLLIAQMKV